MCHTVIPATGISRRFLYFNDDVFLGAPTWPDDFVSLAGEGRSVQRSNGTNGNANGKWEMGNGHGNGNGNGNGM